MSPLIFKFCFASNVAKAPMFEKKAFDFSTKQNIFNWHFTCTLREKRKVILMFFDEEDKTIIQKISEGKITDMESFITESCSYIRVRYKINHFWYFNVVFNTDEIIVPVDEDRFLEKIKKFVNLLDYLEKKNFVQVQKEVVPLNSILPIFREDGSPFDEILVLVYKYQGKKISGSRDLSLLLRMKPRNIAV